MGDVAEGFEALFAREFPRLVRALGVADDAAHAADAVQEAFIAAERRWRRVGHLDDPAGWVRRVAVNRLANGRRDRRRRQEILAAVRPREPADLDALDVDLLDALRALTRRQRLALCLHHLGGYTVVEVADALGVAEGTAKSTLYDARAAVRRRLEVLDDAR